jgi:hypothetical protein
MVLRTLSRLGFRHRNVDRLACLFRGKYPPRWHYNRPPRAITGGAPASTAVTANNPGFFHGGCTVGSPLPRRVLMVCQACSMVRRLGAALNTGVGVGLVKVRRHLCRLHGLLLCSTRKRSLAKSSNANGRLCQKWCVEVGVSLTRINVLQRAML